MQSKCPYIMFLHMIYLSKEGGKILVCYLNQLSNSENTNNTVVREFVLFENNFQSQLLEKKIYSSFFPNTTICSSGCYYQFFLLLPFSCSAGVSSFFKYALESILFHVLSFPNTSSKIFYILYVFQSPDSCLSLIIHLCCPFLITHSWYLWFTLVVAYRYISCVLASTKIL